MYDPTVGRFITEDPIGFDGLDKNLYRYVSNSPTNATDPTGLAEQPATPAMSKAAQELYDLLRKSALFRDYLEKVAKGSTKVERGGFIMIRIQGNGPMYKIVEEIPKTPKCDSIDLFAWPSKPNAKWDNGYLPLCPPCGSIALNKLPEGKPDPDYRVRFWWHTHITGWVTGPDGIPVTGEPHPSGADLNDEGVVGLMVKFDEVTKQLRIFIIERNGTFLPIDPKTLTETPK